MTWVGRTFRWILLISLLAAIASCTTDRIGGAETGPTVDLLIENGLVFTGDTSEPRQVDVGISGDKIVYIGDRAEKTIVARRTIDATGKWVSPGFIDPHTHSFDDLLKEDSRAGRNNLAQGVTTAFYGNDGYGNPYVAKQFKALETNGTGLNVGLFAGHGSIRSIIMGRENRAPLSFELDQMKALVAQAMEEGALGLSTGLFYVPGTYANTDEVVELAKVAAKYGGVYESHIRDESNYTVGLIASIKEAIEIGHRANIPVHIAHIKALGVDVWGQSREIIDLIEAAQRAGLTVTADQYPWRASAVKIHKAITPSWVLAGSEAEIQRRLRDANQLPDIKAAVAENIRRRGGPESLLVTLSSADPGLQGHTLAQLAEKWSMTPVDAGIRIVSLGVLGPWTRVASFNMELTDVEAFMMQPWVMTSSDGTSGHPRRYASFPKKYHDFVVEKKLLTPQEFVYRSSGLVADTFSIKDRGYIKEGFFADIAVIDPEQYRPEADFEHWDKLATGVDYLVVNGELAIDAGQFTDNLNGRGLRRH